MDTCQFTYIRSRDDTQQTVVGVEQAWEVLCAKLKLDGPGLQNATHYFTISIDGPQLFAVDAVGTSVYYYRDRGRSRYMSATDIIYGA